MKKEGKILRLKDFLETNEDNIPFYLDVALENVIDGNKGSTIAHLDDLFYEVFQSIPAITEEKTLLRFAGFKEPEKGEKWNPEDDYTLQDIRDNSLSFAAPRFFNDPMDPLIKAWAEWRKIHDEDKDDKTLYRLINQVLDRIRISCLVDPFRDTKKSKQLPIDRCNPLMWAHYAKSHTGICIQYRIKPENMIDNGMEVIRLLDVNYDKPFPLDGNIPFLDSLCVKGDSWRYEKETRLLLYARGDTGGHPHKKGYEIEAVYMGRKIDKEKRDCLRKLLKDSDIKLYQMDFSVKDITKLEAHEIY